MKFTAEFLVEAAVNYEEMFIGVYKAIAQADGAQGYSFTSPSTPEEPGDVKLAKEDVKRAITWAETNLKKNYRIIWYLRWFKLAIIQAYADLMVEPDWQAIFKPLLEKEINKFNAKAPEKITAKNIPDFQAITHSLPNELKHFFDSAHLSKVQEYPLDYQNPAKVIDDFAAAQREYEERATKWLKPADIREGDHIIVNFPNGWAWWEMDRGYDAAEGRCMGHCGNGNGAGGSKLLSLREPHDEAGVKYWEPHLTFELTKDGQLRQTKGRANSKPKAEYHPYIVELLKQPFVKGNEGGGYKPETNFALTDLAKEHEEQVFWANPSVMGYLAECPGEETLVEFPDGEMWRKEGEGDECVLTLVMPKTHSANGITVWKPEAKFEINSDGNLTTMNVNYPHSDKVGDQNDDANNDLNYSVMQLLKQPLIQGIDYPLGRSSNFEMDDLGVPDRDALYFLKPGLMPTADYYAKFGADRTFTQKVERYFTEKGEKIGWRPKEKEFVVAAWENLKDLIYDHGNDGAQYVMRVFDGKEDLDYDSGMSREEEAKEVLQSLKDNKVEKIGLILKKEHADDLEDWMDREGRDPEEEEFDPEDEDDIISLADYTDDEILNTLSWAYTAGERSGTENEIFNSLKSTMNDNSLYKPEQEDGGYWDGKWVAVMTPDQIMELMKDDAYLDSYYQYVDEDDYKITVTEPYNGWRDYDDDAAKAYFAEYYDVDGEFLKAFGEDGVAAFAKRKAFEKQMDDERRRLIDRVSAVLRENGDQAKRQAAQVAERAFRAGDYLPFVRICQQIDPEAFSFYEPEEENEDMGDAEDALV